MPSQSEIRRILTEQIITALEQGVRPWRQHWTSARDTGRSANVVGRQPYLGINIALLGLNAQIHGFRSRFWGTWVQWSSLGMAVKKRPADVQAGRWGATICFAVASNANRMEMRM